MREIKFRAWDRLGDKFRDIKHMLIASDGHVTGVLFIDSEGNDFTGVNYVNLMQYTGLKDKNGKEIYEGDIVRAKWETSDDEDAHEFKVKWNGAGYFADDDMGMDCRPSLDWDELELEVIGNVYENAELLK